MKAQILASALSIVTALATSAADLQSQDFKATPIDSTPRIISRDANSRVWRTMVAEKDATGQTRLRTSDVTEIGNGLHRATEQGWVETSDLVEIAQTGAVAAHSAHNASFAANDNAAGALQIGLPDKILQFHFAGIFLQDANGNSAYFGARDTAGELHPPGTIIYPNCVDGMAVDLIIVNSRAGLSHSLAFRRQFGFTMADLGLDEATTRILAYTSVDDGPEPIVNTGAFWEGDQAVPDDLLDWGSGQVGRGVAFSIDGEVPGEVNVSKTWLRSQDQRRYIVESAPLSLLRPHLAALPAADQAALLKKPKLLHAAAKPAAKIDRTLLAQLAANVPKPPKQTASTKPMQTAMSKAPSRGVLIDCLVQLRGFGWFPGGHIGSHIV